MMINDALLRIASGELSRLIVQMPPRHGKSELISHYTPAWFVGRFGWHVILASYEANFAEYWGGKARDVIRRCGAEVFGVGITGRDQERWWETSNGGGMITAGVSGPITGKGGRLLILDDPVKNSEEAQSPVMRQRAKDWYDSTFRTRLEPDGAIICIACMVGDTQVLMADGTQKALQHVRTGDSVATYDHGRLTSALVLNWANQGTDTVYAIKMKSGIIVKANERHPFLVERDGGTEWIRLRNLRVGDRVIGVSGAASFARPKGATNQQNARVSACPTTVRIGGRVDIDHPRLIQSRTEPGKCATGTKSSLLSMRNGLLLKADGVPSAENFRRQTCGRIGVANSASITPTVLVKSGGCSATTAISWSDMAKQRSSYSWVLSTYEIRPDRIESITAAGREEVFDIQVAETENFIANGLVSHNTRWHVDDLLGYVQSRPDHDDWEVISLPALAVPGDTLGRGEGAALWPERYDERTLSDLKRSMSSYWWGALYQQSPVSDEGSIFPRNVWQRYDVLPAGAMRGGIYADTAGWEKDSDNDYGVIAVWRFDGVNFYVVDVQRGRWDFPDFKRRLADARAVHNLPIVIEDTPWAKPLIQSLKLEVPGVIAWELAGRSKTNRAMAVQHFAEGLNVYLPDAEWVTDWIEEHAAFPYGAHDDQVDTSTMAMMHLSGRKPKQVASAGTPYVRYGGKVTA